MDCAEDHRVTFQRPKWKQLHEEGITAVDMHFHTNHSDSYTDVRTAVKLAASRKIGFAVTDHNLVAGAEEAFRMKRDVMIIPGIEISAWDGPHILAYFYDLGSLKDYWERNIRNEVQRSPYLAIRKGTEWILDSLEDENCIVSAAHPMGYMGNDKGLQKCIDKGRLTEDVTERLDAYEVICSGMGRKSNIAAKESADRFGLGYTGGTDGHMLKEMGNVVTCSEHSDIDGFLDSIRKKENFIIGTEKSTQMKLEMGAMAFTQYMRYIPSSLAIHLKRNRKMNSSRK